MSHRLLGIPDLELQLRPELLAQPHPGVEHQVLVQNQWHPLFVDILLCHGKHNPGRSRFLVHLGKGVHSPELLDDSIIGLIMLLPLIKYLMTYFGSSKGTLKATEFLRPPLWRLLALKRLPATMTELVLDNVRWLLDPWFGGIFIGTEGSIFAGNVWQLSEFIVEKLVFSRFNCKQWSIWLDCCPWSGQSGFQMLPFSCHLPCTRWRSRSRMLSPNCLTS